MRNFFTAAVIWILVLLSLALTAATLFSNISSSTLKLGFLSGAIMGIVGGASLALLNRGTALLTGRTTSVAHFGIDPGLPRRLRRSELRELRVRFRMSPLSLLERPVMSRRRKVALTVLSSYLLIAFILTIVKIAQVAAGSH